MSRTIKALSALLSYPTEELQKAAADLCGVMKGEKLLPAGILRRLEALCEELAAGDLYDLQERYLLLFDRTRSLSLHLFEHVHGESRDRGQAMIDLKTQYEQHGLFISAAELPDFLPLFLEYVSTRPPAEQREQMAQPAHILAGLAERLRRRNSPYEAAFRALVALARVTPDASIVAAVLDEPDSDPADLAALDAAWEAEAVTFGPGAATSCKDGLIARLRAAKRPSVPVQP
jgi:nitrate reductase delta subunit